MKLFIISIQNFYSGKNIRLTCPPKTPLLKSLKQIEKLCYTDSARKDSRKGFGVQH